MSQKKHVCLRWVRSEAKLADCSPEMVSFASRKAKDVLLTPRVSWTFSCPGILGKIFACNRHARQAAARRGLVSSPHLHVLLGSIKNFRTTKRTSTKRSP